jgi:hypothetical protein
MHTENQETATYSVEPLITREGGCLARAYLLQRADGKSSLAFSLAHVVADGYGYFLFLTAWAMRVRGQKMPPPNCDRRLLTTAHLGEGGYSDALGSLSGGVLKQSGFILLEHDIRGDRLRFREEVRSLEALELEAEGEQLSVNDLLCADLWKKAPVAESDELSTFNCIVDVRRQLGAAGRMYFGNAVLVASVTKPVAELRGSENATVAGWIRNAVKSVPARLPAAIAELECVRARHGVAVIPRFRSMAANGFAVTNLSNAPLAHIDFGVGSPSRVDIAGPAPIAQGSLVLPGRDKGTLRVLTAAR